MVEKLTAILVIAALALFGVQPHMAMPAYAATMQPMAMGMNMAMQTGEHACCPDESQPSSDDPCCDMQAGSNCSYPCGALSPVFLPASQGSPWLARMKATTGVTGYVVPVSVDTSPPFRPPRFPTAA